MSLIREPEAPNFRWNFSVNVLDISFYMLAMNLVSQATILPLLVAQLTTSKVAIGVIPAIFSLGFLLPQLFTAGYAEGLRRKKPFIMWVSGPGERLPWLLAGLSVGAFAETSPALALGLMYFFIAIAAISGGITTPAWYDMIAKVIPLSYRGIWSGVSFGLGAFMGIAGSAVAGSVLVKWPYPQSYVILFALAFGALMVSYLGLCLNREPDSPAVKPQVGLLRYLSQLPAVLRRDHNYRTFLISRSVANLGAMAGGFFIVYASEQFGIGGAEVGLLTAVLVGSQTLMNILWGLLADRKGHKIVLAFSALSLALAALAALLIHTQNLYWIVFVLLGSAMAGDSVSGLNIILEFCIPQDRPTYIGLTNTLLAPTRAVAPLIGGVIAAVLGFSPLFIATFVISLAGAAMLGLWVIEPRHRTPEEPPPAEELPITYSVPVENRAEEPTTLLTK